MPHSASAKKRHRQNLRNRERNRVAKSQLKTQVRKVVSAIDTGDLAGAGESLRSLASAADKAAAAHKIHRNKAARMKSRLSARLKAAAQGGAPKPSAAKGRKAAPKTKA